ncbi:MAG: metallophosphoesterase [Acidobacteriota bacterium]
MFSPSAVAIVIIVLLTIALINFVAIRTLIALYPAGRLAIIIAAVLCNVFWIAVPLIAAARGNATARLITAVAGPPWFAWLTFALLYVAFVALISLIWLAAGRYFTGYSEFLRPASSGFLLITLVVAVAGFIQALVPLKVRHVPLTFPELPRGLNGTKIALLSDLHVGMFTRQSRLRRMSEAIDRENPDIVVFDGDLVDDDPFYVPKLLRGFAGLRPSIPIYAVLGNHEMYVNPRAAIEALRGSRIHLLVNRGALVRHGHSELWLAGLSDFAGRGVRSDLPLAPDIRKALDGKPAGAFTILLSHQPQAFAMARRLRIPLTLCGHTHGGQFGWRSQRITLAGLFLPFDVGWYERDGVQLYVTTGAGYWLVPFRFGIPPEIVMIELRGDKTGP